MNETDNHGQSRIPYHQNSYIYHTASLDSAVRAHNLMFWHEAVKGDYANLEQFCYMNRLSRPVQEMLRSLTKSQISRLVNPVMLDFRLDFTSSIDAVTGIDLDRLKKDISRREKELENAAYGQRDLDRDSRLRIDIGRDNIRIQKKRGRRPASSQNREVDLSAEPSEFITDYDRARDNGNVCELDLKRLINVETPKRELGVEYVGNRVDLEAVFHELGRSCTAHPLSEMLQAGFNLLTCDQDALFMSYSQFNKFLILLTVRQAVAEFPLEIFRLGLDLETARIIACLPYDKLMLLARSNDVRLKLRFDSAFLEDYLKFIIELDRSGEIRSNREIFDLLTLFERQIGFNEGDWQQLQPALKREDETNRIYEGLAETEQFEPLARKKTYKECVKLLDHDGIPALMRRDPLPDPEHPGQTVDQPDLLLYLRKQEYQHVTPEHEQRLRFFVLNGFTPGQIKLDGRVSDKILRRITREIKLEYPNWYGNLNDYITAHRKSFVMGSYKLDELHKVVADGIYIWMRTATRGFRFNRLDYATVLFNFYMLYLEHFSYGADNSQVHRLTARDIHRRLCVVDLADGEMSRCSRCRTYYYRPRIKEFKCPFCRARERLFETR